MIITIPRDWIVPNEATGQLPEVLRGQTTDTWVETMSFWNSLGYFVKEVSSTHITLEFPPTGWMREKNSNMPVAFWEALCDTDHVPAGEVSDWQALWQIHPDVYAQGLVPILIPNSTYVDETDPENPITKQREWNMWGTQRHSHYYLPAEAITNGLTSDRYLIPTWSWGTNIYGSEMMVGQEEQGVNIVSRENFNQANNEGLLVPIPITPTP